MRNTRAQDDAAACGLSGCTRAAALTSKSGCGGAARALRRSLLHPVSIIRTRPLHETGRETLVAHGMGMHMGRMKSVLRLFEP